LVTEQRYESLKDPAVLARHRRLVDLLDPATGDRVVDLGCGLGLTLALLLAGVEAGLVAGVDAAGDALRDAAQLRPRRAVGFGLLRADLAARLPLADAAFDRALCHNVLEALPDPQRFLREVHRVLRPGGRLLLSHDDYDTLVFPAEDHELTRRLVHAYCDTQQPWMGAVDGTIGRMLPAVAARSPFRIVDVDAWAVVSRGFGPESLGRGFAEDVVEVCAGTGRFSDAELRGWLGGLQEAAERGVFVFSVNNYSVLCQRDP
jgi:ubiquinone/menaquinone biosynthesis C-methylase UbiE